MKRRSALSKQLVKATQKSPGEKGKKRHLVKAWDTLGGTGKQRLISHVKLTPAGRETAEYEREHGETPRQVRDAFRIKLNRKVELRELRTEKEVMLNALDDMESYMHEHDGYNVEVIHEDEADIADVLADVLERIVTLALLLDEPLTEDELSSISLEAPFAC